MFFLRFRGYNKLVLWVPEGTPPPFQCSGVASTTNTNKTKTSFMASLLSGMLPAHPLAHKCLCFLKMLCIHPKVAKKENRHGIHSHYNIKASALLGLFFCGCMRVYKPVYIPTQCNIPKLERPSLSSPSISANIQALMIYTELLEQDLRFCREGATRPQGDATRPQGDATRPQGLNKPQVKEFHGTE